jgi:phosphate starvation-inducible PhoH-like protein
LEITVHLDQPDKHVELFGPADSHLRYLRQALCVRMTPRQEGVRVVGTKENVHRAAAVLDRMQKHLIRHDVLTHQAVEDLVKGPVPCDSEALAQSRGLTVFSRAKAVKPSTDGQLKYIETLETHDITFCVGPAGTGKTYLAVAMAVSMLKKKQIRRIILARPAVEAGEKLGFLPGDLQAKVNPYLRPLFDALEDMMDFVQMRKFIELDVIEIIPLAFMRGRTLNESVIICDEAQNTSAKQMLMVLTRLGHGSKMIITGDVTQIDLEAHQTSGMVEAMATLKDIDGIGVVQLKKGDIVRHRLVQNIVQAYKDKQDKEFEARKSRGDNANSEGLL